MEFRLCPWVRTSSLTAARPHLSLYLSYINNSGKYKMYNSQTFTLQGRISVLQLSNCLSVLFREPDDSSRKEVFQLKVT